MARKAVEQDAIFDEVAYKVYRTNNYEKFKPIDGNREIVKLERLRKSIHKYGYLRQPILVNEKFEIIEGQHRFAICKETNIPVEYIVQEGLDVYHCIALNEGRINWKSINYINCYATLGRNDYKYLRLLIKQFPTFAEQTCAVATGGFYNGGGYSKKVKEGTFTCSDTQYENAIKVLSWLKEIQPYVKKINGRTQYLYDALIFCFYLKGVDNKRLAQRIIKSAYTIDGIVNIVNAVEVIEKIYNKGGKKDNYVDLVSEYKRSIRERT